VNEAGALRRPFCMGMRGAVCAARSDWRQKGDTTWHAWRGGGGWRLRRGSKRPFVEGGAVTGLRQLAAVRVAVVVCSRSASGSTHGAGRLPLQGEGCAPVLARSSRCSAAACGRAPDRRAGPRARAASRRLRQQIPSTTAA
jgi:hypothetical protein